VSFALLERSNFVCNVCKGDKSHAFLIHHIEEYQQSQDNSYNNLIVLCPSDHDMVHRGLALQLTPDHLKRCKQGWETQVESSNVQRAAQLIDINDQAIDYVNANRIEELCLALFDEIPETRYSPRLKSQRILNAFGSFDQRYVRENMSGRGYLFQYMNQGETLHYKELMKKIARRVDFLDLSSTGSFARLREMEGKYAFFIGGVVGKRPDLPINEATPPFSLRYRRRNVRIEWPLDPNFLMSMSAISRMGTKQRYIIYCLVRSVTKSADNVMSVSASPLLISWPNKYVHKRPPIAYERDNLGLIDDSEE
jgi:hypothetical protein